jgi:hypothetical protein
VNLIASSTELLDSSVLSDDDEALRARIASDGYVFLRGLLHPQAVHSLDRRAHFPGRGAASPSFPAVTTSPPCVTDRSTVWRTVG